MAYPPPVGQPPLFSAPPFAIPPGAPGMQPPPGVGMLGMPPPGLPPMGFPPPAMGVVPPPLLGQHTVSAPPTGIDGMPVDVPMVMSTATMKVQTTVFVGNISEKASDTLVRQILLRCGQIEGWKRVKDASGKLQAFGFCEYAIPESTLRAIRLLDGLKLGEKALVVKVDAKTRKDLLKYIITKKRGPTANQEEVEAEVSKLEEEGRGVAALTDELTEDMKKEDSMVQRTIDDLLRDHLAVLSSNKTNEDVQRELDVKESILFMAKQSGNVDPDTTLDQVDMEDDMKMLVSDEIKRFRESYQKAEEKQHLKVREKIKEREEKTKDRDKTDKDRSERDGERESRRPPREPSPSRRDRTSRTRRGRSRSRSPRRSRSPVRSRSQERAEREKKREAQREREREVSAREEEEHEEKLRQRKMREREKAYREQLSAWESRERRKVKEHERELKREEERREDMEHEKRHLAEFLKDYDDERDDQQFYKSSLYNRRRNERELEMEDDERDRRREKDELETLRLEVMEKQARDKLGRGSGRGSSSESSPRRDEEEEEDMEVPARHELEEDIPLTKTGYAVPASFKQIQSAPAVTAPEIKGHPKERNFGDGILIAKAESLKQEGESPASRESPQPAKLAFELTKKTTASSHQSGSKPSAKKSKLESIFSTDDEDLDVKPKKKLVPIDYSDEEDQGRADEGRNRRSKGEKEGDGDVSMKLALLKPADSGKKLSSEERKKLVQTLVNNIPTSKEEVFKYELKWDQIDQTLIEKRVGPWINKKITEYIGEAEPVLTEFICNKLACHISPSDILNDIAMVLDDEAEVFVVKLWRLLIYETEAKHLGIAKSY